MLAACLEREDPRDVFISRKASTFADLPQGATFGTASLRRQAIAKRTRPDLRVVPLRGNVDTRLRKLDDGEVDATILALAGLKRLGLVEHATAHHERGRISAGGRARRHRHRGARMRRAHARIAGAHQSRRYVLRRSPASARSWPSSTVPARRRSAVTPIFPATQFTSADCSRIRTAIPHANIARAGRARMSVKIGIEAGRAIKTRRSRRSYRLKHAPGRHPSAGR